MKMADDKFAKLVEKLDQSITEKEKIAKEICELLNDKDKRQELEALTPSMLQTSGEDHDYGKSDGFGPNLYQ